MAKLAKPAKGRALKVYRTAIGFHDAYVAAPSKKAALSAWGTDKDLFARGAAEVVEDPALTADALAAPGTVIRRTRGSLAEQLAAAKPESAATDAANAKANPRAKPAKPKPRPSRTEVDAAADAVAAARATADAEDKALRQEEEALRRRRTELERRHAEVLTRADDELDRARRKYEDAMERWRGDG